MDTDAIYSAVCDYGKAKHRCWESDAEDTLSDIKRLLNEADAERKELLAENERLVDEVNEARKETSEQARLNGMGAEREARLMARIDALEKSLSKARDALAGGLWDYGPGQDEHDKCNQVIGEIDAALEKKHEAAT